MCRKASFVPLLWLWGVLLSVRRVQPIEVPMPLTRRSVLVSAVAAGMARPVLAADPSDQRKTMRTLGDPSAKVTVAEFFSLTCTHCAAFSRETMPQVEKELIE